MSAQAIREALRHLDAMLPVMLTAHYLDEDWRSYRDARRVLRDALFNDTTDRLHLERTERDYARGAYGPTTVGGVRND